MTEPTITDEELAALEAVRDNATPGPWEPWAGKGWPKWWADYLQVPEDQGGMGWGLAGPEEMAEIDGYPGRYLVLARRSEDQAFIAAARQWMPRLIAALRAERAEVERLNVAIDRMLKTQCGCASLDLRFYSPDGRLLRTDDTP